MGGDANGAELFQIEADFSAEIVTFRLVGGCIPLIPPSKSATGDKVNFVLLAKNFLIGIGPLHRI